MTNTNDGDRREPVGRNHNGSGAGSALDVGRVMVTRARRADMTVYRNKQGELRGTSCCEADGGKYGVGAGVLARFCDPGQYEGWAFISLARPAVFRFVSGQADREPEPLVAIESHGEIISVEAQAVANLQLHQGMLVAFFFRSVPGARQAGKKRQATRVFPLDDGHVPLIARLIAEGILILPDHSEAIDRFLGALSAGTSLDARDERLFDAALGRLGSDPAVPQECQMIARVRQTKRGSLPPAQPGSRGPQGGDGPARNPALRPPLPSRGGGESAATDVSKVEIRLE